MHTLPHIEVARAIAHEKARSPANAPIQPDPGRYPRPREWKRWLACGAFATMGLGVAASRADAYIYIANPQTNAIDRATLDGQQIQHNFIQGASLPTQIAVDATHVYWLNTGDGSFGRANIDGSEVTPDFIPHAYGSGGGLAVDAGHIYWTNYQNGSSSIGRASLDGTGANTQWLPTAATSTRAPSPPTARTSIGRTNGPTIGITSEERTSTEAPRAAPSFRPRAGSIRATCKPPAAICSGALTSERLSTATRSRKHPWTGATSIHPSSKRRPSTASPATPNTCTSSTGMSAGSDRPGLIRRAGNAARRFRGRALSRPTALRGTSLRRQCVASHAVAASQTILSRLLGRGESRGPRSKALGYVALGGSCTKRRAGWLSYSTTRKRMSPGCRRRSRRRHAGWRGTREHGKGCRARRPIASALAGIGDVAAIARAMVDVGVAALRAGDLDAGRELLEKAVGFARERGLSNVLAVGPNNLADLAIMEGRLDEGMRFSEEASASRTERRRWPTSRS